MRQSKSFRNILQHVNFCQINKICRTQTNRNHHAAACRYDVRAFTNWIDSRRTKVGSPIPRSVTQYINVFVAVVMRSLSYCLYLNALIVLPWNDNIYLLLPACGHCWLGKRMITSINHYKHARKPWRIDRFEQAQTSVQFQYSQHRYTKIARWNKSYRCPAHSTSTYLCK